MARSTPKNKFYKSGRKKSGKKRRRRIVRRGFRVRTKEGQMLEKNLEEVVNQEILEHRRIPRATLDQIFSSLCKSKTSRGLKTSTTLIKQQRIKSNKGIIETGHLQAVVEMYKKERAMVAKGMPEPKASGKINNEEEEEDEDNDDDDDDDDDEDEQPKKPPRPSSGPSQGKLREQISLKGNTKQCVR